ncbi:hypothetical protein ACFSHT_14060 [Paraburkholderia silviterrae]|uniref:Tetratricopeptide repeat protein n=1 Tax=Paraburkholderia silviterrae TaxID=2528715 RepID=A0A4R5LY36_9BURK|nr:hypothetical protein [Paraburkholderia silviterrae]TDG17126.1 hypothetical protein EYW47_39030 [Paraburkholderia silviterrae]
MGSKFKALLRGTLCAMLFASAQAMADNATSDAARSAATLAALSAQSTGDARAQAILAIAQRASGSDLDHAVSTLRTTLMRDPADLNAKMYYGYGLLRLARQYLANKNFMQAAERAKQGFFYVDEAADSAPDDWRLRYQRTRVDAFAPPSTGRCVIALKDTAYLKSNAAVPRDLMPMIDFMRGRAQDVCRQGSSLAGGNPEQASAVAPAPPMTPAEIANVLEPIVKEQR